MKKNSVYGFMLVAFCFVLVSCGNVFSKVQIKAKPSIYAPLGKEEFKMSTYVTVEKIEELLGGGKENSDFPFKIYDYDGDKDRALAFRLYYPLMDLDLDFGKYLEGIDLTGFDAAIPAINFTVPKLEGLSVDPQTISVPKTENFANRVLTAPEAEAVNKLLGNAGALEIEDRTVPLTGEGLKSVTFAKSENGKVNAITMALNPTMSQLTCTPAINITLPDKTTIDFVKSGDGKYVADFGGKTLSPGDLIIGGTVSFSGTVSEGNEIPKDGIGVTIALSIEFEGGFESATVEVPEGTKFEHTVSFDFPEEAKKMVESVTFLAGKLGFDLTVTSTLPQGNDIDMSINAFDENLYKTIESNVWSFRTTTDYVLKPEKPLSATIKVTPPGYNESEKTMTIRNVAPGTSYSLSGEAKIIADWKSITLKDTATDPFKGSFPADGAEPIDLSKFTELLPEGIAFKDIGAALFISSPLKKDGSQTDLSFTGEVSISGGNGDPINLIPEDEKSLSLVNPVELPAEGKIWSGDLPTPSVDMGKGITDFLNSRPTSLNLNYSLSLGSGTPISKDSLPEDGKTSVKAEIVITLPIKLAVTKNAEFDVFALANIPTDKDLFGRTEAPATNEQINDLLKMLTSLNIGIDYNNNLGVALGAKVHLLTDKDGNPTVTKDFMLEKGKNTYNLELTGEQIKQVMEAYPFCPRVYVELPSEDVVLEREGGIDLSLGVTAVTDINYIYDLKGGK